MQIGKAGKGIKYHKYLVAYHKPYLEKYNCNMSDGFRMDPMPTLRSPFRDTTNRPSVFCAPSQLDKFASRPTVTSQDIMKSRIEQLEREKVDLALQLHIREEKDRTRAQAMDQLEASIATEKEKSKSLEENVELQKSNCHSLIIERDQLESEVRRLTRQQESASDTSSLWQKMTAASRELRRAEDECKVALQENIELVETNKRYMAQIESMKEKLAGFEKNEERSREEQSVARESIMRLEVLEREHHSMSEQLTVAEISKHEVIDKFSKEMEKIIIEKKLLAEEIRVLKSESAQEKAAKIKALENFESGDVVFTGDDVFSAEVIDMLRKKLAHSENKRRQLHNQLQVIVRNNYPIKIKIFNELVCCRSYEGTFVCTYDVDHFFVVMAMK